MSLPMERPEVHAEIVNAVQRHAAVIVQKSLAEGFGLTVTEAMWKARPLVVSAVGGLVDQVEHGRDGLLVRDPTDLDACAEAIGLLLRDPELAARLGRSAHRRAADHLDDRLLRDEACSYAQLGSRSPSP
jgi:trehalose synthase